MYVQRKGREGYVCACKCGVCMCQSPSGSKQGHRKQRFSGPSHFFQHPYRALEAGAASVEAHPVVVQTVRVREKALVASDGQSALCARVCCCLRVCA